MYPQGTVELAKLLSGLGTLDRENAAICGVSIRAIRHWRAGDRRTGPDPYRTSTTTCPRCGGRSLDDEAYAYLLGLYLGDGHITRSPRTHVLWLACSDAWPGLLELAKLTTSLVMPSSRLLRLAKRSGLHLCQERVKALAVFVSAAWARAEAPAQNRARA